VVANVVSASIDEVKAGMVIAKTISIVNDRGVNMVFARPNTRLTDRIIDGLRNYNVKSVSLYSDKPKVVLPPDEPKKPFSAARRVKPIIHPPADTRPVLSQELQEKAVKNIRNLFDASKAGMLGNMTTAYQAVKELDTVIVRIVDTIKSASSGCIHINEIKSYDEYTYHHSLSVAVLSVAIGQEMGLGEFDLHNLCRCALLHDIGKVWIPHEIIAKPSKLNSSEYEIVKQHAQNGGQYLKNIVIGNMEVLLGVIFHHEKYNGGGYPRKLKEDDIPLYSRIISVADVYDAVTSIRPYRHPLIPSDALELILFDSGVAFDPDVVEAFKEKLEMYPVNSVLELSDNRKGIVVDNRNERRPVLLMTDSGALLDLSNFNNLNLTITRVCAVDELSEHV